VERELRVAEAAAEAGGSVPVLPGGEEEGLLVDSRAGSEASSRAAWRPAAPWRVR
jgi:hypothetical protein